MRATTLVPLQVEDAPSGAWMPGAAAGAGGPTSDLISSSSSTVCFFFGWLAAPASYDLLLPAISFHLLLQPCAFSLDG